MDKSGMGLRLRARRGSLVLLVLLLTASATRFEVIAPSASLMKFPVALALLFFTIQVGRATGASRHSFFTRGLLALAVLASISTFWSIDPSGTVAQAAALVLLSAIIAMSSRNVWTTQRGLRGDFTGIFWPIWSMVALGLVSTVAVQGRDTGLFTNANSQGALAALVFAMSLSPWIQTNRAMSALVPLPALLAVLGSESRTALVSCVVVAAIRLLARPKPVQVVAMCAAGAVAVTLLLFRASVPLPATIARFGDAGAGDPFSGREAGWRLAIRIWRDYEVGGVGFRAGETAFERYRTGSGSFQLDGAHSSYLQVLLELGVLGAIVGLVLVAVVCAAIACAVLSRDLELRALALVPVSGLLMGMTESALVGLGQSISWTFWLSCGMLISRLGVETTRAPGEEFLDVDLRRTKL